MTGLEYIGLGAILIGVTLAGVWVSNFVNRVSEVERGLELTDERRRSTANYVHDNYWKLSARIDKLEQKGNQ